MTVAFPGGNFMPTGKFWTFQTFLTAPIIFNSDTGTAQIPTGIQVFNIWNDIDFHNGAHWNGSDPDFPEGHVDAMKAVLLGGIIITGANGSTDNADLFIAWRAKGDNSLAGSYQWQAKSHNLHGTRQEETLVVPVRDGTIQTYWRRSISFSCGYTVRVLGYWL